MENFIFQFKNFVEHVAVGNGENSTVDAKRQQATGDTKVRKKIFFFIFDLSCWVFFQDVTVDKWINEFSNDLSNESEWQHDWAADAANLSSLDE